MVIIQPTPFCNINCSYCYLPDRSNKHVIAQSTIEKLFTELFASGWNNPEVTVLWHAGEPLAVPISFYREAFATIERLRPKNGPWPIRVKHSFQTNGMLINEAWCDFFKEWDVGVGVSIDGPRELHDAHRKTRSGAGTFDKTIAGIRCLRDAGYPFHVLSVLSRASLEMPGELLAFYVSEVIDHHHRARSSPGRDFLGQFVQLFLAPRHDNRLHAFLREQLSRFAADACARSGNQRRLSFKAQVHVVLPFR